MATITKSSSAPAGFTSFAVANQAFDVTKAVETTDGSVITYAENSPYLDVEIPAQEKAADAPAVDPRTLPSADHLSSYASQESIDAAKANEAAIRKAVDRGLEQPEGVGEVIPPEQQQKETFATIGVDAEPVPPVAAEPAATPTTTAATTPAPAVPAAPAETTSGSSSTADTTTTGASN